MAAETETAKRHILDFKNNLSNQLQTESNNAEETIVNTINKTSKELVQPALQSVADATATLSNDVTATSVKLDFQEQRVQTLLTRLENATKKFDDAMDSKCNTALAKFHHRCSEIMDGHIEKIEKAITKIKDRPTSVQIPSQLAPPPLPIRPSQNTDILPLDTKVTVQCGDFRKRGIIQVSTIHPESGAIYYTIKSDDGMTLNVDRTAVTEVLHFPTATNTDEVDSQLSDQKPPAQPNVASIPTPPVRHSNRFNIDPTTINTNNKRRFNPYESEKDDTSQKVHRDSLPSSDDFNADTPLMPNQYHFKGQPRPVSLNDSKMMAQADKWALKFISNSPQGFYESLRTKMAPFYILITPWNQIRHDTDIAFLNDSNSKNSELANIEMSKAVYNLCHEFRKTWFKSHNYTRSLLQYYQRDNNGFGFLAEVIKDFHPRLRNKSRSETRDKPRLRHDSNWYSYVNKYIEWVDFEATSEAKRTYTRNEHVSNILLEMHRHSQYQIAVDKIKDQMQKIDDGIMEFPPDLELRKIALTVMSYIPREIRDTLATEDSSDDEDNVHAPAIGKINKVHTRSSTKPKSSIAQSSSSSKPAPTSTNRTWIDVKCKACGKYGHCVTLGTGCDATAIATNIADYTKHAKDDFDKKTVQQMFHENELAKRKRRQLNKKTRNKLRRKLRESKDQAQNEKMYDAMKTNYIRVFKSHHDGLDLDDPRTNAAYDVHEYDILESESDSDDASVQQA
jgi:hypothetical protein